MATSSSVSLATLRSQLQYISSDFNNLTTNDLKELKLPLLIRIWMEIMNYSPILRDRECCSQCAKLLESRESSLSSLPRDERRRAESEFRLAFMTVIQKVLIDLRWPPACEAFSDSLTPLIEDKDFGLKAIEYVLSIALPAVNQSQQKELLQPSPQSANLLKKRSKLTTSSIAPTIIAIIEDVSGGNCARSVREQVKEEVLPGVENIVALKKSFQVIEDSN